jgi:hypothetical protein
VTATTTVAARSAARMKRVLRSVTTSHPNYFQLNGS